jgi:hypothetical protein
MIVGRCRLMGDKDPDKPLSLLGIAIVVLMTAAVIGLLIIWLQPVRHGHTFENISGGLSSSP